MNYVALIGRITKKPELEYTAGNTAVTKFTIAVDRNGKDKGADFIRVTAFDRQAENICRYMDKGRQIAVQGRLQTGSYEKDGKTIYTQDIILDRSEFIGRANDAESRKESYRPEPVNYARFDDDLF